MQLDVKSALTQKTEIYLFIVDFCGQLCSFDSKFLSFGGRIENNAADVLTAAK